MRRRNGFTLIELLVVIAILGLLLSFLLPSLTLARKLTQRGVCATNCRQMALATIFYAEDHESTIMPNNWRFPYNTAYRTDPQWGIMLLIPYVGGDHTGELYSPYDLFICPENPAQSAEAAMSGTFGWDMLGYFDTDYVQYCGTDSVSVYPGSSTRIDQIDPPVVLFTDAAITPPGSPMAPMYLNHDYGIWTDWSGSNCSRADGSAAWVDAGSDNFFVIWPSPGQWAYQIPRFPEAKSFFE